MDIHIIVGGKPPAQLLLVSRAPENCAVQKSAVLKAVGKSADIDSPAPAEAVYRKLHLLFPFHKDRGTFQGVNVLLSFPEIHLALYVLRDKMAVALPVVFVVAQGKSPLLLHAKHAGKLEEVSVCLVGSGLSDTDNSAALIYKTLYRGGNLRIAPPLSSGMGRVRIAHIDKHVNILQKIRILLKILKADKAHVKGSSGERLDNPRIRIVLLEIDGVMHHMAAPCAHLSPAVQHCDLFHTIRHTALNIVIQLPELVADRFHIIHKFREIQRKLQISAIADPVDRLAQDRPPGRNPVNLCLLHRISALMEGVREKVRQKSSLTVGYSLDIADQAQSGAVPHAPHDSVQTHFLEFLHKRLRPDPVVSQKHHGLLAVFMGDVHHFLHDLPHFPPLESLEVLEFLRRNSVLVIIVALVNNIFRPERIPRLLLKLFQNIRANGSGISIPVHVFLPRQLIKYQRELVKKRGKAQYIYIGMLLNKLTQPLQRIGVCLGLTHIKGNLMLHVLPLIYHCIVHMHGIPHNISEEAHGIVMERHGLNGNLALFLIIGPI